MRRTLLPLLVVAAAAACGGAPEPQPVDAAAQEREVQRDVDVFVRASYAGDLDVVLGFAHPTIIAGLGGIVKAREKLAAEMKPGLRLETFRFPARPDLVRTSTATFAIVPTLTIVDDRGERTESLNYQFGVQPHGAPGFRYIGGTAINAGNVREMFPDFPADYTFPRTSRKKL